MTDMVRYTPPTSSLDLAPQAWKLAEKIAGTEFVPAALRGKPEAVLACILAGHEAGISPLQALSKIHIIEGRPAMSSELMRALVLQHGHELVYDEVSTTSVTASGRRRGSERWTKTTWTMDDAKRGGLDQKQNWRRWPRAMLTARATAELCRMVFPDVLAGISYTIEELSDGDGPAELVDFGPPEVVDSAPSAPPTPNRARASKAITRDAPASEPDVRDAPPAGEVPALPGDDDEIIDAEVVEDPEPEPTPPAAPPAPVADVPELPEPPARTPAPAAAEPEDDWPSGEWPSEEPPAASRHYTGPQIVAIRLGDRFGIKGNTAEARAERITAIVRILGRPIESSKDLTPAEIQTVIERIDAWPQDRPLYEPETATGESATPAEIVAETPKDTPPRAVPAITPPAPRPEPVHPDQWTGEQWRDLLQARKVKVTETLREAQRLGAAQTPPVSIPLLDSIAGSGIAEDLLGWVEDLSLERRK